MRGYGYECWGSLAPFTPRSRPKAEKTPAGWPLYMQVKMPFRRSHPQAWGHSQGCLQNRPKWAKQKAQDLGSGEGSRPPGTPGTSGRGAGGGALWARLGSS